MDDPRRFGVLADGMTDDVPAIQAALDLSTQVASMRSAARTTARIGCDRDCQRQRIGILRLRRGTLVHTRFCGLRVELIHKIRMAADAIEEGTWTARDKAIYDDWMSSYRVEVAGAIFT
jgi:hypothetical protein